MKERRPTLLGRLRSLPSWVQLTVIWGVSLLGFVAAIVVQDHLSGAALVVCWAAVVLVAGAAWIFARQRGHLHH